METWRDVPWYIWLVLVGAFILCTVTTGIGGVIGALAVYFMVELIRKN